MKLFTSLFGLSLLSSSVQGNKFVPNTREELEIAVSLYCQGVWPGPQVRKWDVNNITNFDRLFADTADCNPDVEKWDVSSATSLEGMFSNATGFDHSLSKWDIPLGANITNFFDQSCPANSSAVINPAPMNPEGELFDPSRKAVLGGLTPYIPVVDLGELRERCVCDADLGYSPSGKCVLCGEIGLRLSDRGICVPICPVGAVNDGDSCSCTNPDEYYDKYENKCICDKGAWGVGSGTCEQCPEFTDRLSGTQPGIGPVEDRCECVNAYEVWDGGCVCEEGAYGDGDDDCEECPDDMEAKDDIGFGTGDLEDRCQCKRKYMEYDDDEDVEKCVCEEGAYEFEPDKCQKCSKIDGAEGKDGVEEGLGDENERCQCKDENAVIVSILEKCVCELGYFKNDGGDCEACGAANPAVVDITVAGELVGDRCL